jgi:hypothetical protein
VGQKSKPETILEEAQRIVYGDREQSYGHPGPNMEVFAQLVEAYLEGRAMSSDDDHLDGGDGAVIVMLLKIARIATGTRARDTIVDVAGYAAVLARVEGIDE